ncbi:terminase [Camelimonas fluminis]|uniref:PBSX family phage terminase large subunit n=1 Tax=Camelimonas fluminis TaxID=1576911 RepID=A0ABV7UI37_9HYPH|nr:phage terminase large subunit [Camelimonas fluminis]GHE70073.1 terminase [Camelimonas fluminis]
MTTARIELPPKLIPVFSGEADVRGAYGGRGSAKTRSFAKMSAIRAYMWDQAGRSGQIVCGRQFMNSLADSSLEEVKLAIADEPWLAGQFEIGEKYIRTKSGRVYYTFVGLDRNIDSIKSKARILLAWVDEAEPVSDIAWTKLIPTLREEDSELWVTWNPESDESATHKRFRAASDPRYRVAEINYRDNPKFPLVLERQRKRDLLQRPEKYGHIWDGDFLTITDAVIFQNRVSVEEFAEPPEGTRFFYGADWGFAKDPTVLIRFWIDDDCLFVSHEAFGHGVEIDETPALFDSVPGSRDWPIKADGARPETISYMRRKGFNISAAEKWPGSVEDGIAHMKGFSRIVVHERCAHIAREFRLYSYKVDRVSGDVLPIIVDDHNHGIDAVRYGLDGYIQARGGTGVWARLAG